MELKKNTGNTEHITICDMNCSKAISKTSGGRMDSPSRLLSEKIIAKLIQEKLLTEQEGKKMLPKLAEGKLKPEDWLLPFEVSEEKGAKQ
jgi:hypothetical protein